MLRHAQNLLEDAGWPSEEATVTTGEGDELDAILFEYANRSFLIVPQESTLEIQTRIGFAEEDAEALASLEEEKFVRVWRAVRRELLGKPRTAFTTQWRDQEDRVLEHVSVSQRFVPQNSRPEVLEKFIDRVQEITNTTMAAEEVLAHTFGQMQHEPSDQTTTPSRAPEVH